LAFSAVAFYFGFKRMASMHLKNVSLRYPIFTPKTHSIKTLLFTKLGGKVSSHNNTVVIEALRGINLELKDGDRLGIVQERQLSYA
jgi:ABC-2 type transport system ATP-binding protein